MALHDHPGERRTSADLVFETLYREIASLELLPGTKLSEAELAIRFGVSRQPVRDAFARLNNAGLLVVRPQRATKVRNFSSEDIRRACFIRCAVEVEVLRGGCRTWDASQDPALDANMAAQIGAVERDDADAFHAFDYEFHKLLCGAAGAGFAFETIAENKAKVDRLCLLGLTDVTVMRTLHADHVAILEGLRAGDEAAVEASIRLHLGRLRSTIGAIRSRHEDYFDD